MKSGNPARHSLFSDHQNFADVAGSPKCFLQSLRFQQKAVFFDAAKTLVKILDDLVDAYHPDYFSGPIHVGGNLAASERSYQDIALFSNRMGAAQHVFRGAAQ